MKSKKKLIELTVNGEEYELAVEPQETLLDVLRNYLGLTGTKEGCGTGECGSCTVLLGDEPVLSCLTLASDCQRQEIITIEGLGDIEGMTPVQEAFLEKGAVQCGFCTPGLIMASTAFVEQNRGRRVSRDDIRRGLAGNLCRCTGYVGIIRAVEACLQTDES